jgi:hypothetical protein
LLDKNTDDAAARSPLTLVVDDQHLAEHFEEWERAFFAAGDEGPAGPGTHDGVDSFDDLSGPPRRRPARVRLVPLYRLGRLWLSMRMRLLISLLRDRPMAMLRPLPVPVRREALPRLYSRWPGVTVAAAVVLGSTVASVWAGVVLAATRIGN